MDRTKIGVIGCGNISGVYLSAGRRYEILEVAACADVDMTRAEAKAKEHGIPRASTVDELLTDPNLAIVLNLTPPFAHCEVATRILEAGKSAYSEKPLGVNRAEGQSQVDLARSKGLLLGCAPDTFMGAGIQTCRKVIDDGLIGEPVGAAAFMMCHGHESWHPDPEFYYMEAGGPLLDMGPYYMTALVNLLGPVKRVTGSATITFPERTITSQPKNGTVMKVTCPTHVAGVMEFASGAIGTLMMSFDVWAARVPCIEIYGTEGSLAVPDPNGFGGPVTVWRKSTGIWADVRHTHGYADNNRGIGVADMCYAMRSGRPHRASGDLAFHVLDTMVTIYDAWDAGKWVDVASTCERPAALPLNLKPGTLDE